MVPFFIQKADRLTAGDPRLSLEERYGTHDGYVAAVRAAYPGPLTYAGNWPSYPAITFWNDLDYVGIDAYYPVTNKADPTADELTAGWQQIANGIKYWRQNSNLDKPVLLTELGYRSAAGANMQFAAQPSPQPAPDQQAAALQAALTVLPQQPWFHGLYYWNYFPNLAQTGFGAAVHGREARLPGFLGRETSLLHNGTKW